MIDIFGLSVEMLITLALLCLAVVLFVSEWVRIDVAALIILLLIGFAGELPGVDPLLSADAVLDGFSSNAVIAMIAIMIIGAGLEKAGLMATVADLMLKTGRNSESRVMIRLTSLIGMISGFMQNVGATALFLPVVSRISDRTGIALSRLMMPLGFCAILGGTLSMIGCSSLIMLNDLMQSAVVDGDYSVQPFGLFDVTPIGLALLSSGIVFFAVAGRHLLPVLDNPMRRAATTAEYLEKVYGIQGVVFQINVEQDSSIAGKSVRELEDSEHAPQIISLNSGKELRLAPNRDDIIWAGSQLWLLGHRDEVEQFAQHHALETTEVPLSIFEPKSDYAGIAEVVIPPGSRLINGDVGEFRLRRHYRTNLLGVYRSGKTYQNNLRALKIQGGDTLIVYGRWKDIAEMEKDPAFVIASDFPKQILRPEKLPLAIACFLLALLLTVTTSVKIALALLVGAVAMVLCKVITIDEAYKSVSWRTIFLLAALIPLGAAVEKTGTAAWIASHMLSLLHGASGWQVQTMLAILGTVFTLVMSNVGAVVLLVPIAMSLAVQTGADPAIYALTVALATSNSFLLPTHQVNALIMGPAGYRNTDYMRVGGIMTLIYLVVLIPMINLVL
jgi:di/tricarboxylate transporter